MLRLGLLWLAAWHIVPREDFTLTWWIGPHRAEEAWCFLDPKIWGIIYMTTPRT